MADDLPNEARRRHNGERWVITPPGDGVSVWSGSGRPLSTALHTPGDRDRRGPDTGRKIK